MNALLERIDEVRRSRPQLPDQLSSIAEEMPGSLTRRRLIGLAEALQRDVSSAEIAARYPEYRWLLTIQSSSATADAMTAMLEQSAHQHRLQNKKVRSIAYPFVLMLISAAILLFACALLVPPFDQMFQEFGLRLPPPTRLIVGLSRFVVATPVVAALVVLAFFAVAAWLLWLWIGDGPIKRALARRIDFRRAIRTPLARVCLQLAELCDEGVALPRGLRIAAGCDETGLLRPYLACLADDASEHPDRLSASRVAAALPPNFLFALHCGGRGDGSRTMSRVNTELLRELSANYRDVAIHRKEWASFLIGQLSVIGVGVIIVFIVVALFAPLVSLISALS